MLGGATLQALIVSPTRPDNFAANTTSEEGAAVQPAANDPATVLPVVEQGPQACIHAYQQAAGEW